MRPLKAQADGSSAAPETVPHGAGFLHSLDSPCAALPTQLASFLASLPDAVVATDLKQRILFLNPAAEALFALESAELVGRPIHAILSGELGDCFPDAFATGAPSPLPHPAPVRSQQISGIRSTGEQFPVEASAGTGEMEGARYCTWILRDVSARVQAEQALRASENHLRAVLMSEPECVKLLAPDCTVLEINPAGLHTLEAASREDVVGLSALDLVLPQYRHGFESLNRRVFAGETGTFEFEICGMRGTRRWMHMRATPLRDEGGSITASLSVTHDITERKRNESIRKALVRRNEFFVRALGEIVYEHDVLGDHIDWAGDTVACVGWTIDQMGASTAGWLARVHPEDLQGVLAELRKPNLDLFAVQYRFRHKDGSYRWMFDRGIMARDSAGKLVHITGIMWDVTARKQAEDALRESDERFRLLAENIREVFWILDQKNSRMLYVSPAYEKIWGCSSEPLLSSLDAWIQSIHPDDRPRVVTAVQSRQSDGAFDEEYRIVRTDGSIRWIHDRAFPVEDRNALTRRIVGVARDITTSKRALEELRKHEERFRVLTEHASDLITVVNSEGRFRYQSPSSLRIVGYTPEFLLGRSVFELIHSDDKSRVLHAIRGALASPRTPITVEYRLRHANGSWRLMQSTGQSIPGESDDGFIVVNSRDTTEQRHLEEQFRQSQKMEAIGQLAGGVAHDFNNMLSVIAVQSELINLNLPPGSPLCESVAEIHQAAQRAAALTRQLLAFSRREIVELKILDLNAAVTNTERMLRRLIGEDVHLTTSLSSNLAQVRADAGQIDQILMNLAVNARDAMPKGGNLTIETRNVELDSTYAQIHPECKAGAYVLLSISDTGCGIPEEIIGRIFEPFFTTKGVGRGTGLGLSVVHGIVKQSNGHLDVSSERGLGTTFKIYLPAISGASQNRPRTAGSNPRGTETILLVEDDDSVRRITGLALESLGYKVLRAHSGEAALPLFDSHHDSIALLLTDVVMPHMSGRELADTLRARKPGLKVIFQSGYTDDAIVRHGILQADVAFIQKPCRVSVLAAKLREALDSK